MVSLFLVPLKATALGHKHVAIWRRVQALTAEMNMQSTKGLEDKEEIVTLRNEVYDWKQKYYNCRRQIVASQ